MKTCFFLWLLLFSMPLQIRGEVSDTTRLIAHVPTNIYKGENIRITYTVYGGEGKIQQPDDLGKLKVLIGPMISQKTEKGKLVYSEYIYILECPESGTYHIGPATWCSKEGKCIESEPLQVTVLSEFSPIKILKSDTVIEPSSISAIFLSEDWNSFFIHREAPLKVVVGSTFQVTYKLYMKNKNICIYEIIPPEFSIRQIKNITSLPNPRNVSIESYQGENYYSIVLWQGDLTTTKVESIEIKGLSVICTPIPQSWEKDTVTIDPYILQVFPNH